MNKDGVNDIVISAVHGSGLNRAESGVIYVVNGHHGTRGDVDVGDATCIL